MATLLATAVSWAVVQAVSTAVVDQPPAPLSHGAVSSELRSPGSPQLGPGTASPSPAASPQPATGSVPAAPTAPIAPPNQSASTPTRSAASTAPPGSSPTTTRTFTLVGGTAQLSCTNDQVALNWATPNQGFWVETGSSDSGQTIDVKFRSDTHESELQASCASNQVQGTVSEKSS